MDLGESWQRLLDSFARGAERATAVDDCLDTLVEILEADRGLILVTDAEGVPFALNARGHNRALTPLEHEEISGSIVREAFTQGRPVSWEAQDILATGSMMRWGIRKAIAAPLLAPRKGPGVGPQRVIGAVYVDFRAVDKPVTAERRAFFDQAMPLLSAVLQQTLRLQTANEKVRRFEASAVSSERGERPGLDEIIVGQGMAALRDEILSVVHGRSPILILGESGTGKTLLAEAIGEARGRGPVIRAVLGMSDDLNTITSELMGHEKGAFSGALARRAGLVELADGGTLILDELLNLPTPAQKLLLDFTQFGTYRPLGYGRREPKQASVRLIACTNGNVDEALASGRLRSDLYYRLAGARFDLPPLRERRDDIPRLAAGFLARTFPGERWTMTDELVSLLRWPTLAWPGNVRQLESALVRAVERASPPAPDGGVLRRDHLGFPEIGLVETPSWEAAASPGSPAATAIEPSRTGDLLSAWQRLRDQRDELEESERRLIVEALATARGVVAHAARELGTSRTGLLSRMQTLGVGRAPPTKVPGETRGDDT